MCATLVVNDDLVDPCVSRLLGSVVSAMKSHSSVRHAFSMSSKRGGTWLSTRYHACASMLLRKATALPVLVAGMRRSLH